MVYICSKCWNEKHNCSCNVIEVDENISPVIARLNKKGYKTRFCCGGHTGKYPVQIYIMFEGKLNISIPKGFEIEISTCGGNHDIINFQGQWNLTTEEQEIQINEKINILTKWAKSLKKRF